MNRQEASTGLGQADAGQDASAESNGGLRLKAELRISAFAFFLGIVICLFGLIAGRVLGWKNMEEIYPLAIGASCLLFGFWRLTTRWNADRSPELFAMMDRSPSIRVPLALGLCLLYAAFVTLCVGVAVQLPSLGGEGLRERLGADVSGLPNSARWLRIIVGITLLGFCVLIALACLFPLVRASFRSLRVALGLRPSSTLTAIEWFARRHRAQKVEKT